MFVAVEDNSRILPAHTSGRVGHPARLDCLSDGDVIWYHETPQSSPWSRKASLIFNALTVADSGEYFCYGLYENSDRHFLAKAEIDLVGKLQFWVC